MKLVKGDTYRDKEYPYRHIEILEDVEVTEIMDARNEFEPSIITARVHGEPNEDITNLPTYLIFGMRPVFEKFEA